MKEEDTKVADIFDKDIENFGKDLDKMIEHLNIVIATHNKQVEEIERLNKELKSLQDSYDIEEEQANYHIDLTDDLREEVDRLNNIINEYEKLLYIIRDDNGLEHLWCKDLIFDKLQELKGSDK